MTRPSLVLALDLSSRTGWALGYPHEKPQHGVWTLEGSLGRRCSCLAAVLEDAIAVFKPDVVVMEAPLPPKAQTSTVTARLQFGLAAIVEMVCEESKVPCEEARADDVRKLIVGRARPPKEFIVAWCVSQGWVPAEHNDADALMLLRYWHIIQGVREVRAA